MKAGRELDALAVVGKRGGRVLRKCLGCGSEFKAWMADVRRGRMNYCSHDCSQRSKRKHEVQEFNGVRFYLSVRGYMENPDLGLKMHRVVWEFHYGPVPKGFLVHHKNEIKADNRLENLEIKEWSDHTAEHSRERWRSGKPMGKQKVQGLCIDAECDRPAKAKHLCTKHYQRMKAKERGRWL